MGGGQSSRSENVTINEKEVLIKATNDVNTSISNINKTISSKASEILNKTFNNTSNESSSSIKIIVKGLKTDGTFKATGFNANNDNKLNIKSVLQEIIKPEFQDALTTAVNSDNNNTNALTNALNSYLDSVSKQLAKTESTGQNTPIPGAGNKSSSFNGTINKEIVNQETINNIKNKISTENIVEQAIKSTIENEKKNIIEAISTNEIELNFSNIDAKAGIEISDITAANVVDSIISSMITSNIGTKILQNTGLESVMESVNEATGENKSSTVSKSITDQSASAISTGAITAAVLVVLIIVGGGIYYLSTMKKNDEQVGSGCVQLFNLYDFIKENRIKLLLMFIVVFLILNCTKSKKEPVDDIKPEEIRIELIRI
jgi:hypothetical protein